MLETSASDRRLKEALIAYSAHNSSRKTVGSGAVSLQQHFLKGVTVKNYGIRIHMNTVRLSTHSVFSIHVKF